MRKIKRKILTLLIIGIFATLLSGCEFTFLQNQEPIFISGYVTFENNPLKDVQIVSDFYHYDTTNADGYYEFKTTTKNLVFYARKNGYSFTPKTYDINALQESYDFEGKQAKELNGALTLTQILVAPTSIVSIPGNNFEYKTSSGVALKLNSFNVKINKNFNHTITTNQSQPTYLEKNTFTNILKNEPNYEYSILNGKANFTFNFELKAYYKLSAYAEEVGTEGISIFKTNVNLDTGDLDENDNLKFSIPSINSHYFTYNLQFVFKYIQK